MLLRFSRGTVTKSEELEGAECNKEIAILIVVMCVGWINLRASHRSSSELFTMQSPGTEGICLDRRVFRPFSQHMNDLLN